MKWKITEQGPRVLVEVWREDNKEGLYKAYIRGRDGRFLLGTLVPEQGRLYLKRLLTVDSLRRQNCWPIQRLEEELVCSFRNEPIHWEDEVLRNSAGKLPRHTICRDNEGFSLIFPFDPCSPFPMTPVFCFARVEDKRLIFSFHSNGSPYIFCRDGKYRREDDEEGRERHGKSDHEGTECAGGSAGV